MEVYTSTRERLHNLYFIFFRCLCLNNVVYGVFFFFKFEVVDIILLCSGSLQHQQYRSLAKEKNVS